MGRLVQIETCKIKMEFWGLEMGRRQRKKNIACGHLRKDIKTPSTDS